MRRLVLVVLALAACGSSSDREEDLRRREREVELKEREQLLREYEAAKSDRDRASDDLRNAEAMQRTIEQEVEAFRAKIIDLGAQLDEANAALVASRTAAGRDAASARVAELQRQRDAIQAEIDKRRAKVKPKCPPDQPLC